MMLVPEISLSSLLLIVGVAQSLFFALLLWRFRHMVTNVNRRYANQLLCAFLLVCSLILADQFLDASRYYVYFPHLLFVASPFAMLIGPLIYGFIDAETQPETWRFTRRSLWHLLPFVLYYVALLPLLWQPAEMKLAGNYLGESFNFAPRAAWQAAFLYFSIVFIEGPVELLSVFAYLLLVVRLLFVRRQRLLRVSEAEQRIHPVWLIAILFSLFLIAFLMLVSEPLRDWTGLDENTYINVVLTILVVAIFCGGYIGFMVWQKTGGWHTAVPRRPGAKYKKSSLSQQEARAITARLNKLMEGEKIYRDSDLSLPRLAEQVGASTNHLSQVINTQFRQSFSDYVNSYRVEDAQERLLDPSSNDLILTIALDSGFNSKAAFYTAFKKSVGVTPSQFKKSGGSQRLVVEERPDN